MGVKRYVADKDTTITDSFKENLTNRAVDANMGASDILEVFSIFGQAESSPATVGTNLWTLDANITTGSADGFAAYDDTSKTLVIQESAAASGSQHVFIYRSGSLGWVFQQRISSSTPAASGLFGQQMHINSLDNYLLIGAGGENDLSGAIHVYASSSVGGWTETEVITPIGHTGGIGGIGRQTVNVDKINNRMFVGSWGDFNTSGSAYVFASGSSGWVQEDRIQYPGVGIFSFFGIGGDISGSYLAVGAISVDAGRVYIFNSGSSGWTNTQVLTSSVNLSGDLFGTNVVFREGGGYPVLAIGASRISTGSSYVSVFTSASATGWYEVEVLTPPVPQTDGDGYGHLDIYENTMAIGAAQQDTPSIFVYNSGSSGWALSATLTGASGAEGLGFDILLSDNRVIAPADGAVSPSAGVTVFDFAPIITNPSALEASRTLVQFPVSDIVADRAAGTVPASGSVSFYLNLSNAPHGETTPKDFELVVVPVSTAWTEGNGLDMERYLDAGVANWLTASIGVTWTSAGGDFSIAPAYTASFEHGDEDLSIDVTPMVEAWIAGTTPNYGVGIKLPATFESSSVDSYFTKRFFGRRSEHFFKLPWIEARFDDSIKDSRNSFFVSSSLVPAEDNLMTLFLYNRTRKGLRNIPAVGTGPIYMSLYSGTLGPEGPELLLHTGELSITGGAIDTGIYTASVAIGTQETQVWDVWHNNLTGALRVDYFTGSVVFTTQYNASDQFEVDDYVLNITNMKPEYSPTEEARFRVFTRLKNWNPTIYTVSVADIENKTIEDAYYRIFRVVDDFDVIPYGTGSDNHTLLSYDKDGNYFDLDMSIFEPDYQYGISFIFKLEDSYYEQSEVFKFRVR